MALTDWRGKSVGFGAGSRAAGRAIFPSTFFPISCCDATAGVGSCAQGAPCLWPRFFLLPCSAGSRVHGCAACLPLVQQHGFWLELTARLTQQQLDF